MGMQAEAGREFWRGVLAPAGPPRSRGGPSIRCRASAEHEAAIPGRPGRGIARLADELAVPLSSVLLAAHAKVLAALSGEREVVTGYVAAEGAGRCPAG